MKNFAVLSLLFFLAIALTNCRSVPRTLETSEVESSTLKEKPKKKKSKSPTSSTLRDNEGFSEPETLMVAKKKLSRKKINSKAQKEIAQGDFALYSRTDAADRRILKGGKARRMGQMFASE